MNRIAVGEFNEIDGFPVFVDGVLIEDILTSSDTNVTNSKPTWVEFNRKAIDAIRSVPLGDFLKCFDSFSVDLIDSIKNSAGWAIRQMEVENDYLSTYDNEDLFQVRLQVGFDVRTWNQSYGIADLANEFSRLLKERKTSYHYWPGDHETFSNGFGIEALIDSAKTIDEVLDELYSPLQELVEVAETNLLQRPQNSVSVLFDFPEPIRPACEQYLLYFSQFLRDLGISAQTEMKEQTSNVLFTVTPTNRDQALDAIREALDSYLQIPGSPQASSAMLQSKEIAIIQLNANLLHLQSQVALATAVFQAKEATISAQQTEIDMLRQKLDLRGYLPAKSDSADSEPIIEGVLSVKKLEHKGVEVNLPEILRRLKRLRK
jgi:hypothetical protein